MLEVSKVLKYGLQNQIPAVQYTKDFFYILANVSNLINVGWYLGTLYIRLL
jgi:hypothetical protein